MVELMYAGVPETYSYFATTAKEDMPPLEREAIYESVLSVHWLATNLTKQLKVKDPVLFPEIATDDIYYETLPSYNSNSDRS